MKYSLLFVVGALLFVQFAHALPHMKRESVAVEIAQSHNSVHHSVDSSSEEDTPEAQLIVYTLAEIAKLATWILERGSVVVKNTVKELKEIPVKDELLQANITRMSEVAKESSEFTLTADEEGVLKLLMYMVNFATMMDDYENMPADSKLKHTLQTALENNGYARFESDFEEKVIQLAKDFDKAFGEYVKVLSPAEKVKQAKLLKWYDDFKAETDEEKKLDKFGEFFDHLS
ncbi:uncharacterized protein LOC105218117 [Zeugodacus cucurbitae]|uniref:Exocyst complex component SEC5 n=1 Tax=Zeugodacus cucurbitae TaxID=28588 RepID=A0A0A1WGH8_ZEUCU|nr:uncharacterized protein LOC105218117 [Zeugodacus cucurbitae]